MKKNYEKPELEVYGNLKTITKGAGGGGFDMDDQQPES